MKSTLRAFTSESSTKMANRRQLSFQDTLTIIKEIDDGMKQVDVAKKYGLAESTIATFLKERKQIEEALNSNEINPQRKRLKIATNENIYAAVDSILINIENTVGEPFKAVKVKEACGNIARIWWKVTEKTIRNCWEKADLCFMEDKQTHNDQNSKNGDVSDAEECVLSLRKSLTQLEEKCQNVWN
ncbi:hypothetical protein AVEN_28024-1 [Araneus ventricosus]|uniref:HTH psq-type domain-containing protein n=1 Tax=Araneus ventricosus TaxID=182803 RepID=A0A4Y2BGQ8_ARAVE|nr:hypothetical protein AVEN_28024-1 [Araneus ventricosus]